MDCCILCLQKIKIALRVSIFAKKSQIKDVVKIIKTHFWIEPDANIHKFICKKCWEPLKIFHEFYCRIQQSHQLLEQATLIEKSADNENEDASYTSQRRRGRPIRSCVANQQIEKCKKTDLKTETESVLETEKIDLKTREEWDETEIPIMAEVKLEELPMENNENEFMNIFYNMVDDKSTVEQPLQEMTIKEEFTANTENSNAKDPIDEELSYFETAPKAKKIKTALKKERPVKEVVHTEKAKASKCIDEFIAKNYTLNCHLCQEKMETYAALKQHFRQKHNMRGYALCCGKRLHKRCVLVDHIHVHLNPKYFKCTRCEKVLADRRSLEKHNESHDDKKERIFVCPTCSKSFFRRCVYQRHILLHLPEEQRTVQCPKCDKTFATKYVMNQHLKLVHLNVYAKVCDVCGKMIRGRAAMERHREEHEGIVQSSIQCEQCGISLTNKYGLARHIKVQHTEEYLKPQVCPICSKVSPNITAHSRHIKYMHNMERKHACPMCDKAFRRATELKEHMTTHTGEVLYTCPHCPKTFNSNANMYAHRKRAHPKEWQESRQSRYRPSESTKPSKSVLATALETTASSVPSIAAEQATE